MIFLLYGCAPYTESSYSSSTWSSNYSSYTPVEDVKVNNEYACSMNKELKYMTFGECLYKAGLSHDICEKHSNNLINFTLDCSDYSSDAPVKTSNEYACNKSMTFGECIYTAGLSYKECKKNIDYLNNTIKLPLDCNRRNSGTRSSS